ncbi:hypothetical protein ACICHK_37785 [Streptomyces sp. AHU1]|uniref:hypothetical protein n=1 Tax=Streptomyces sp. AHU1 TaxID=3377215 RepID=UPI0038783CA5
MDRLCEITFLLPDDSASRTFLDELRRLLSEVAYADFTAPSGTAGRPGGRLTLTPPRPAGARPVTAFELADVDAPEVALDTGHSIGVSEAAGAQGTAAPPPRIGMADLTRRMAGHVRRVDHTGVNVPACVTPPERWRDLRTVFSSASAMYRYPTGEDWPFVLPATATELGTDIDEFVVGREPRFELVHDRWLTRTLWQFALWTDLTRTELERLFPEPDGFTFPELEEVFRVVPVAGPWPGLDIRFDLCYRIDDGPSAWETGEWLVTEGGRIR